MLNAVQRGHLLKVFAGMDESPALREELRAAREHADALEDAVLDLLAAVGKSPSAVAMMNLYAHRQLTALSELIAHKHLEGKPCHPK